MSDNKNITNQKENHTKGRYDGDPSEMRKAPGYTNAVPGVNTPSIDLPAFNPPVPNRAWTEMKNGKDIEALTEEERRELYVGKDNII